MWTATTNPIPITEGSKVNRNARFALNLAKAFNKGFDPEVWTPTLFHKEGWFECEGPDGLGVLISIDGRQVRPIACA